jgi:hypothetical protein
MGLIVSAAFVVLGGGFSLRSLIPHGSLPTHGFDQL